SVLKPRADTKLARQLIDLRPAAVHDHAPGTRTNRHRVSEALQPRRILQRRAADFDYLQHRVYSGRPSFSSKPSIRFAFWSACPAAPFTRLSNAAKTISIGFSTSFTSENPNETT